MANEASSRASFDWIRFPYGVFRMDGRIGRMHSTSCTEGIDQQIRLIPSHGDTYYHALPDLAIVQNCLNHVVAVAVPKELLQT